MFKFRMLNILMLSMISVGSFTASAEGLPKMASKESYKVGFSQSESNSAWRIAETKSMKDEAEKVGWNMVYTDAGGSSAKQVADVNTMIAQKVDLIFIAPREEKPLASAVMAAKRAGIPVILLDRTVDARAKPGVDYVTFVGSDFVNQGQRSAEWLIKHSDGKAKIIELMGTVGATSTNDRQKGFVDALKNSPDMKIIASQSGEYERDKGRQVTETLLLANPDVTAVYAHNDEMALGAATALEAAGKVLGKDVVIVTVDGSRDAVKAVADGRIGAIIESNPRLGPFAFAAAKAYSEGKPVEPWTKVTDGFYDKSNAADDLKKAF